MTDRFLFGIIIYDIIIKNSKAKWREKDRKKIKGLVSGGNLPYHAQRGEEKTNIWRWDGPSGTAADNKDIIE